MGTYLSIDNGMDASEGEMEDDNDNTFILNAENKCQYNVFILWKNY